MNSMKDIVNQISTIKVKTLIAAAFVIWLLSILYTYFSYDTYLFHKLSKKSIDTQKKCMSNFFEVFKKNKVPVILFDIDILPELFQARPKSWHNSEHECKTLCKYHPVDKNVITFAIQGSKFEGKEKYLVNDLQAAGFVVHITRVYDPRLLVLNDTFSFIPSYLWLARDDHVIHVSFLHERINSYVWVAPVSDRNWRETVNALAPALSDGWHSMEKIGTKFPTYAQAFDISQRFLGLPLDIDGHRLNVPYHIREFLYEYEESHFIECSHERARLYKLQYESNLSSNEKAYKDNARKLLLQAKQVLDKMKLPFWLSKSTCLGWYRQCDIIPHTTSVNIGIWIHSYEMSIIEDMHDSGLIMTHKFGKPRDSLEMAFVGEDGIRLNVFFYYHESDFRQVWHSGTQAHDGRKYKFLFPKFSLCWTEFLKLKIRVPCDPEKYIKAHYGKDWMFPVKDWLWNLHPPNVQTNGRWDESDWEVAIQIFELPIKDAKPIIHSKTTDRNPANHLSEHAFEVAQQDYAKLKKWQSELERKKDIKIEKKASQENAP